MAFRNSGRAESRTVVMMGTTRKGPLGRSRALIAAGLMLARVVPVDAQTLSVEVGGSGLGVTDSAFGLTAQSAVGGGYIGGSLRMPLDVFSVYAAGNWWSSAAAAGQFGASARLVPADWPVRPSLRIGSLFNAERSDLTAGLGFHVGRHYGGLLTADVGWKRGSNFAVVHIGGYYRFGG